MLGYSGPVAHVLQVPKQRGESLVVSLANKAAHHELRLPPPVVGTGFPGALVVERPESSRVGSGLVRAPCGEHVEGDGGGPGLLLGAERLAGERLEVLCETPL